MRGWMTIALATAMTTGCLGSEQPCSARPADPMCQTVDGGASADGGPSDAGPDVGARDAGARDAGADVGPSDSGRDVGPPVDAHVPCDGTCTGATAHCLVTSTAETCVACLASGDCSGTTSVCDSAGDHTCVGCVAEADCTASSTHCDTTARACVACLDSTQCTTAAAARCDTSTHACTTCTTSADCTHLSGTPVCGAGGLCVQCTPADESACGANSCNPATSTCTSTPRTSVATCRACVADSECTSAMDRCVAMEFMGASHGSYCLRQLSAGCVRPFGSVSPARASTSGDAATTYCTLDESVATCEAYNDLVADVACTMPSDCGAAGLADGRCQMVGAFPNRCTYTCGTASDCPPGKSCNAGYCGS